MVGGSGFVGRHLVERLCAERYLVRVPAHQREKAKALILLPTVDVVDANVHDPQTLAREFGGMDVVINLVGVLHGGSGERSFEQAHVGLTRKITEACGRAGVRRYLHMSALGANVTGPSEYLRTKGTAEAVVRASGLDWTIFRPSVIFGRDDRFLNMFARLQQILPVIFLAKPQARFQPVFVEDVATAMTRSIEDANALGRIYELCGPRVYTLRELVAYVGSLTGHDRPIVGLGDGLSYLQALALEFLPGRLMSRDNIRSMQVDNVSAEAFPFGIQPASLEAEAPLWLAAAAPRARYRVYRNHARRAS